MKLGIHQKKDSFSERWITYCEAEHISWKQVDCYKSDIMEQLADCDALMWHFSHAGARDVKFARQLLYSVQASGKSVFPDFNTMWHFDDKVGQKYLLEAIKAPLVPSYVFYDKEEALGWVKCAEFPKVFKLRSGAGSSNVRLVSSETKAVRLIKRAFGKGFSQYDKVGGLKERLRKYKNGKGSLIDICKGVIRFIYPSDYVKSAGRECGYVYFQDFIPGNDHDIRVIVICEKAFAIKRMARENDFRASGSGTILYDRNLFDEKTIALSFDLAARLKSQCVAFDYVNDNGNPLVVEISYGFSPAGYDACQGYWDKDMAWHEGKFNPYGWMVDLLLKEKQKISIK